MTQRNLLSKLGDFVLDVTHVPLAPPTGLAVGFSDGKNGYSYDFPIFTDKGEWESHIGAYATRAIGHPFYTLGYGASRGIVKAYRFVRRN